MPDFQYECFCYFMYDVDLSYEQILEIETQLVMNVQQSLIDFGGIHSNFIAEGNGIQAQCVFLDISENSYYALCKTISCYVGNGIYGKVLLVSRNLQYIRLCRIKNFSCQYNDLLSLLLQEGVSETPQGIQWIS